VNAKKDPRTTITQLDSGMRIDTATKRNVKTVLSIMVRMHLRLRWLQTVWLIFEKVF